MMSHKSEMCGHDCGCVSNTAVQSLDEVEFERGIWYAAQYGDLNRIEKLLQNGKYTVDQRDSSGYTALHYAARNGHINVCQCLIQKGADINATTRSGMATSLHRACTAGKIEIVKFLLSKNANVHMKDCDGKTALDRATNCKHQEICNILKKHDSMFKTNP